MTSTTEMNSSTTMTNLDAKSDPIITFVIPSIGRPSLDKTLASLQAQKSPRWRAIVCFDGDPLLRIPASYLDDGRIISIATATKLGSFHDNKGRANGRAGSVRNYALETINSMSPPWVGFLDDDDYLGDEYVSSLETICSTQPEKDLVIFSIQFLDGVVLPDPHKEVVTLGISFCLKSSLIMKGLRFKDGQFEDSDFVQEALNRGVNPLVTHQIQYYTGR